MKHQRQIIQNTLAHQDIHPVLVDIGASAGAPTIWEDLAHHAIYIGFDPDLRDLRELSDGRFHKGYIINKAVTDDPARTDIDFYLTKYPHCSSTLPPDSDALADYVFADFFSVVGNVTVPATTLHQVVQQLSLSGIDWIKTDSQGTDLRLFTSMPDDLRAAVLAIDIEPGLIDAYKGEDLFVDVHTYLVQHGFWMSHVDVRGIIRSNTANLQQVLAHNRGKLTFSMVDKGVRISPGWCEARYLRRLDWLEQHALPRRAYELLWVFALVDGQYAFALDVSFAYAQRFGEHDRAQAMQRETVRLIRHTFLYRTVPRKVLQKVKGKLFSAVRQVLPR
jgi:FkbM family methyltransferase